MNSRFNIVTWAVRNIDQWPESVAEAEKMGAPEDWYWDDSLAYQPVLRCMTQFFSPITIDDWFNARQEPVWFCGLASSVATLPAELRKTAVLTNGDVPTRVCDGVQLKIKRALISTCRLILMPIDWEYCPEANEDYTIALHLGKPLEYLK